MSFQNTPGTSKEFQGHCAIDIETCPAPGVDTTIHEKAALDQHRNKITVIASYNEAGGCLHPDYVMPAGNYVTHGGKFDAKTLITKKLLTVKDLSRFTHDTMLMGLALPSKVSEEYLDWYAAERTRLNKQLGSQVHRSAGKHSLKTMAPYFLGVDPFWEDAGHSEAYALKDVEYTWRLAHRLEPLLKEAGTWDFYKNCLVPWSQMLCEAELRGMQLDFDQMAAFEKEYGEKQRNAEERLKTLWSDLRNTWRENQIRDITADYTAKKVAALARLQMPKVKDEAKRAAQWAQKLATTGARYDAMRSKALEKVEDLSIHSSTQVRWALKEQGYDITSYITEEESSGKEVLQALADDGKEDAALLLEYRQASKLLDAYFPSYRAKQVGGALYGNFHMDTVRTGRLSSSDPNLQQISKKVQSIFKARPGYKFVYRDVSAIEPRLIAYHTEDASLVDIFLSGTDFHSENVRAIMTELRGIDDKTIKEKHSEERDFIKEFGLSLVYGAGPRRIQVSSVKRRFPRNFAQCKRDYANFKAKYSTVFEFKEDLEIRIENGETVVNVLGRPMNYDGANLNMTSMNTLIQSGGSDILLGSAHKAIVRLRSEGIEVHPVAFIHDAAVLEVPEAHAAYANKVLEDAIAGWRLPLVDGRVIPLKSDGGVKERL